MEQALSGILKSSRLFSRIGSGFIESGMTLFNACCGSWFPQGPQIRQNDVEIWQAEVTTSFTEPDESIEVACAETGVVSLVQVKQGRL